MRPLVSGLIAGMVQQYYQRVNSAAARHRMLDEPTVAQGSEPIRERERRREDIGGKNRDQTIIRLCL
jgi:hypothetical protein